MEDTLRGTMLQICDQDNRLNPCCNGRYSQSLIELVGEAPIVMVLILVVMEDTLRESLTVEQSKSATGS